MIPQAIADEVRAYFRELAGWIAAVLQSGHATGQFRLRDAPAVEAQAFMSTVHGAMLTARLAATPKCSHPFPGRPFAN